MAHQRSISTVLKKNSKKKGPLMDTVSFCVDDVVQRRLTLGGLFVNSVGVVTDEMLEFYLRNENRGKIPELVSIALHLGLDQRLALKGSARTDSELIPLRGELAAEQETIWRDEYSIKIDLAELLVPRTPLGRKYRLLTMVEQVAQLPEFFFQSDKKAYDGKVWKFTDKSLDEVNMTHQFTGTFGSWVADEQEAPDGCVGGINLSTVAIDELNRIVPGGCWNTETLPMRQVHGRVHWRQRKSHLDQNVMTFCQASRLPGGVVPGVVFLRDGGEVCVCAVIPRDAGVDVRFRRAVVPSKLEPCSLPFQQVGV